MEARTSLTPSDFLGRLRSVGVTWAAGTLSKWVSSGLIEAPYLAPGRPKDEARYSLQAVGEACALFAFFKSVGRRHPKEKTKLAIEILRTRFRDPDFLNAFMVEINAPRLLLIKQDYEDSDFYDVVEANPFYIGGDTDTHGGALRALGAYWKALAGIPIDHTKEITLLWAVSSKPGDNSLEFKGALISDSFEDSVVLDSCLAKMKPFLNIGIRFSSNTIVPYPLGAELITKKNGSAKRLRDFFNVEISHIQLQEEKK